MDFIEKMATDESDYILVIGTKLYRHKYDTLAQTPTQREKLVRAEARIINYLVTVNQHVSNKIIPVLLEGSPNESLPPLLHLKNIVDFTKDSYYSALLELIRDMHHIDQRDPFFKQRIAKYKAR